MNEHREIVQLFYAIRPSHHGAVAREVSKKRLNDTTMY